MARRDVELQSRISQRQRIAVLDHQISLHRREYSLLAARAQIAALRVHLPVAFRHADSRSAQRLDGRRARRVIAMCVGDDDVLDVPRIQANLLHRLEHVTRGLFVRRIDQDQAGACTHGVGADTAKSHVIDIVENLEGRNRRQVVLCCRWLTRRYQHCHGQATNYRDVLHCFLRRAGKSIITAGNLAT
jgi:hypothetical protein